MTPRTVNRLAALFLDVPAADARRALQPLRVSRQQSAWITSLGEGWHRVGDEMRTALMSGAPRDDQVRRWIAVLGRLHAGQVLRVAAARWRAERAGGRAAPTDLAVRQLHRRMRRSLYRDPIELAQLRVGGDDLRRLGIPAGPIYAKILQALLDLVLDDPARNTPETLLAEVPRIAAAAAGDQATPVAHPSTEQ